MTDIHHDPLHRYPVVRTSDSEELWHLGSQLLGAERLDLRNTGNFEARVNLIELESTALSFGTTTCDVLSDHRAENFVRVLIALKGRGLSVSRGKVIDINERQFALCPAGVPWHMVCLGGHRRLTLRLDQQALMQRLTASTGIKPQADYHFDGAIKADSPQSRGLFRLISFLSKQLDEGASDLPSAVYRELEDAVQLAFLCASQHKYRELLDTPGPMPDFGLVKRLENFIEASWREAITIERLVAEAGISARSLFRVFERVRGYSPMAFAKSVRLRRAREMLTSGDPAVTVAAVAQACNFVNPGHFARYYRETFGELPSVTMLRGAH
jgi:AraC-like DNA-binding protein